VNGTYNVSGTLNGKAQYSQIMSIYSLEWSLVGMNWSWVIRDTTNNNIVYSSTSTANVPPTVNWIVIAGTTPAPFNNNLTILIDGTGTGMVYSLSPDNAISCPNACSSRYQNNNPPISVALSALPSWYSTVGWTSCIQSGNNCNITLDADKIVKATFTASPNVLIPPSTFYGSIQSAYGAVVLDNTLILTKDTTGSTSLSGYPENLSFDKQFIVTIEGGKDETLATTVINGYSVVTGFMKISSGRVNVKRIIIR
jgi:hypothetical protein